MSNILKKDDSTNHEVIAQANSNKELMSSVDLLRGQQQLAIAHDGEVYLLRVTKQGKLILTK